MQKFIKHRIEFAVELLQEAIDEIYISIDSIEKELSIPVEPKVRKEVTEYERMLRKLIIAQGKLRDIII